jgi:hypothetical protein
MDASDLLTQINKKMKASISPAEELNYQQEELNKKMKLQSKSMKDISSIYTGFSGNLKTSVKTMKELNSINGDFTEDLSSQTKSMKDTNSYSDDFSSNLSNSAKTTKDLDSGFQKVKASISTSNGFLGNMVENAGRLTNIMLGSKMVGSFIDLFQSVRDTNIEMKNLGFRMGLGEKGAKELNKSFAGMMQNTGASAENAKTMTEILTKGRIDPKDIKELGTQMLNFSAVTGVSATQSAQLAKNLSSVGNLSLKSIQQITTGMAKVQQKVGMSEETMENLTVEIQSSAFHMAALGGTEKDIAKMAKNTIALGAALEKVGVDASKATQLIDRLTDPENLEESLGLMSQLGISIEDAFSGKDITDELKSGMSEMAEQAKAMGPIAGAQYAKSFGMSYRDLMKMTNEEFSNSYSESQKELEKQMDPAEAIKNMSDQMDTFFGRIDKIFGKLSGFFRGLPEIILVGLAVLGFSIPGIFAKIGEKIKGIFQGIGKNAGDEINSEMVKASVGTQEALEKGVSGGLGLGISKNVEIAKQKLASFGKGISEDLEKRLGESSIFIARQAEADYMSVRKSVNQMGFGKTFAEWSEGVIRWSAEGTKAGGIFNALSNSMIKRQAEIHEMQKIDNTLLQEKIEKQIAEQTSFVSGLKRRQEELSKINVRTSEQESEWKNVNKEVFRADKQLGSLKQRQTDLSKEVGDMNQKFKDTASFEAITAILNQEKEITKEIKGRISSGEKTKTSLLEEIASNEKIQNLYKDQMTTLQAKMDLDPSALTMEDIKNYETLISKTKELGDLHSENSKKLREIEKTSALDSEELSKQIEKESELNLLALKKATLNDENNKLYEKWNKDLATIKVNEKALTNEIDERAKKVNASYDLQDKMEEDLVTMMKARQENQLNMLVKIESEAKKLGETEMLYAVSVGDEVHEKFIEMGKITEKIKVQNSLLVESSNKERELLDSIREQQSERDLNVKKMEELKEKINSINEAMAGGAEISSAQQEILDGLNESLGGLVEAQEELNKSIGSNTDAYDEVVGKIEEINNALADLNDEEKTYSEEIAKMLEDLQNSTGIDLTEELEEYEEIANAVEEINSQLEEQGNLSRRERRELEEKQDQLKEELKQRELINERVKELVETTNRSSGKGLVAMGNLFGRNLIADIRTGISNTFTSFTRSLGSIKEGFQSMGKSLLLQPLNTIGKLGAKAVSGIGKAAGAVAKIGLVGGAMALLGKLLKPVIEVMTPILENIFNALLKQLMPVFKILVTKLVPALLQILAPLATIAFKIVQMLAPLLKGVGYLISKIPGLGGIGEGIVSAAEAFIALDPDMIGNAINDAATEMSKMGPKLDEMTAKIGQNDEDEKTEKEGGKKEGGAIIIATPNSTSAFTEASKMPEMAAQKMKEKEKEEREYKSLDVAEKALRLAEETNENIRKMTENAGAQTRYSKENLETSKRIAEKTEKSSAPGAVIDPFTNQPR